MALALMTRLIDAPTRNLLLVAGIGPLIAALIGCGGSAHQKEVKFLQHGDRFVQQKNYSRALLEYRNAAQVQPKDAEPYYRLGLAYEVMDDPRDAVGAYREALERDPKHAGAQVKVAGLMAQYGDQQVLTEAEQRLQGLVSIPSTDSEALDTLALAEFRLGKADEAARLLLQAVSKFPADIKPAILLALVKLRQNDIPAAEQVLKNAAVKAPKSPAAALALGRFYLQTNHPEQAEPEIRRALALDSHFAPALLSLALLETKRNRLDEAEQSYRRLSTNSDEDYQHLYGLFLFQRGKTEAALGEFRRLAKQDPNNRAARTRLIAAYVNVNQIPEAQKVLSGALRRNAKDGDALIQRAGLYLRSGDVANAKRDLDRVLHDRPDSAPAHLGLAAIKRIEGNRLSERQELLQALLRDPKYLPARLALARNYVAAREAKSALELTDGAPQEQKNIWQLRVERNWALLGVGDRQTARTEIEQLLSTSRSADALEQDGFLNIVEEHFAAARRDAEEILAQNPENLRAVRLLIDSYTAEKNSPAGLQRLREIVARRPKSAPLQHAFGQILLASGNRADARKAFEAAAAADPSFASAQLALGQIDFLENRLDSARNRVAAVLASQPRNITALLAAGDIELRAVSYGAALEKYRAVLEIDSSNVLALMASASLLVLENQLDEALRSAQRALELAPDNPRTQETLAWVYYRTGNYRTAAEYLKMAVDREPTASRQYHLALSYFKNGERSLGRVTLEAALQKDPALPKKDLGW